jgi:hypothetical protein
MISVHETEKLSLQQIEQFLLAAKEVRFEAGLLCQQEYLRQGRPARGLLRRYNWPCKTFPLHAKGNCENLPLEA